MMKVIVGGVYPFGGILSIFREMGEKEPMISVLMGVYYKRDDIALLKHSVSSILDQTCQEFELLICDDGSTAEAMACLDALALEEPRVRLIRRGDLFLLAAKLNACLREAKGEWIARMDDDDFSHPKRFEMQVEYLKTHPEAAFVGCNVNLWRDGNPVGERVLPEKPLVRDFYFVQPYIHPTLMFRREALLKVGGYSESETCLLCEDYDLLLRLCGAGYSGANMQEKLFDYSVPATAHGNRKMRHRWNEVRTRFARFRELGVLPGALPYVVKPIFVGLIPEKILRKLKNR